MGAIAFSSPQVVAHASGLPWLMGKWAPEEYMLASVGPVRVGVIGVCPVTPTRLCELTARVRMVADVDELARKLPGSFHLVASVNGQVRVQGSVSGLRRIFHAQVSGIPMAGDRANVLAVMAGGSIDERVLATRVACGLVPAPLGEQSMWSQVSALSPDHYLVLQPEGAHEVRWWWPPEPDLPLTTGAARMRQALCTAMAGRHPGAGRVSADLSGGMDSTSLCFLAAREVPELVTFRCGEAEAGNDDAVFAGHAARALPRAEHLTVPPGALPTVFADPAAVIGLGEPCPFTRTTARIRYTAGLLAEHGSRWHLAGHGADELFSAFPGYLRGLLHRHPITAIRHLRGYRALGRWPFAATISGMVRSGDVPAWWRAQADRLTAGPLPRCEPSLDWGIQSLRAPDWVTGEAVDVARAMLRETAEQVLPLAGDRGQHQAMLAVRTSAPIYAQLAGIFAEAGVGLDLPYFDDRVIEAALGVRLHERATPWRYKPLLAEAMRGIVPDVVLGRSTKGEFSKEAHLGLRHNLRAVLEVFADSALAARGLIDFDRLRARLLAPHADNTTLFALEHLLGCETWLRAATEPTLSRMMDAPTTTP